MGCGVSQSNLNTVSLPSNDRYDRKELIGVGHHGRVYKSFYQLDKKQYANKVIDQFRSNTDLIKISSQSSILINRLKKLRNQKIATYHQIDFTEKEVSIIMELSREGTLKKYIKKNGPQSQQSASKFIENILQGLDYLHNAGVLHKDLKSTNILMTQKNEIKISDYGIAQIYDDRLTENENKNRTNKEIDYYRGQSLPYMAPEVIKNIEMIDKSDVWSLGCILVQLITGETPWINLAQNFEKAFEIISRGAIPPLPKNITKQCQSFLESCLAVIPTQRLSVRDLLCHNFITKYSKNSPLFFEQDTSLQNIKVTLDKPQKVKKVQQKTQKTPKQLQNYLNDSLDLKRQKGEINSALKTLVQNKQSRQQKRERVSREIDQNFIKIREAIHSMDQKSKKKAQRQQGEQLKANQQLHTVILNNKKIQLDPVKYKNNMNQHRKMKTQENQWNSPPRNKSRAKNSVQIDKISLQSAKQYYDPFKNHSSSFEDSLDAELRSKNMRVQTEPNISEYSSNREYFKKPLKLLKKKLKESKQSNQFTRKLTNETNKSTLKKDLEKLEQQEKEEQFSPLAKLRVYTQTKRQERVIDTELARAERDMFISQQKIMKKLREQQKNKWEEELKLGAQILKKELKQYYTNPHPLLI